MRRAAQERNHELAVKSLLASDASEIARQNDADDMQLMFGLSGDQHALTRGACRWGRCPPWLNINLLTGFAATAMVAFFERTIAR